MSPSFPPTTKTNTSKFQFNLDIERLKHEQLAQEIGQPLTIVLSVYLITLKITFYLDLVPLYQKAEIQLHAQPKQCGIIQL